MISQKKTILYLNPTAHIMKKTPIRYDYGIISRNNIKADRATTIKFCQAKCKCFGINGGCPPYSPIFQSLFPRYKNLFIYYLGIEKETLKFIMDNMSNWTALKVTNKILGYMSLRIGNSLEPNLKFLSSGACKLCRNGSLCNYGRGIKKCKHPEQRRYSLESTGIMVESITKQLFGFKLEWFKKGFLPFMLIQVGAIFCDSGKIYKERFEYLIQKEACRHVNPKNRQREFWV